MLLKNKNPFIEHAQTISITCRFFKHPNQEILSQKETNRMLTS